MVNVCPTLRLYGSVNSQCTECSTVDTSMSESRGQSFWQRLQSFPSMKNCADSPPQLTTRIRVHCNFQSQRGAARCSLVRLPPKYVHSTCWSSRANSNSATFFLILKIAVQKRRLSTSREGFNLRRRGINTANELSMYSNNAGTAIYAADEELGAAALQSLAPMMSCQHSCFGGLIESQWQVRNLLSHAKDCSANSGCGG